MLVQCTRPCGPRALDASKFSARALDLSYFTRKVNAHLLTSKDATVGHFVIFGKKKCQFWVVLVNKCNYHVTKSVKGILFQLLVNFDFLKPFTTHDAVLKI